MIVYYPTEMMGGGGGKGVGGKGVGGKWGGNHSRKVEFFDSSAEQGI